MFVEEILKSATNVPVEGTYLIIDMKLKPFNDKEGHFLTFNLQDKTGLVWAKIWDNAERIAQELKDVSIVTIQGRTNIYNNKTQVIVDRIKVADEGSYNIRDLVKISSNDPDTMWEILKSTIEKNITSSDYQRIWQCFLDHEILDNFKLWPGGKGTVHHAYQHGLLEHTLSVVQLLMQFKETSFDLSTALIGAVFHDIGKIEAYTFDGVKTDMSNIGRLQGHTVLGYYQFREILKRVINGPGLSNADQIVEEVGHIILSHHGEQGIVKPMTIEAKLISIVDSTDADINYMTNSLLHNADDKGWFFDTLHQQFYFKRPVTIRKRKKMI